MNIQIHHKSKHSEHSPFSVNLGRALVPTPVMKSTGSIRESVGPKSCQLLWFYPDIFPKFESEWTLWLYPGNPLGIYLFNFIKRISPREISHISNYLGRSSPFCSDISFFSSQSSQYMSTWGITWSVEGGLFGPWLSDAFPWMLRISLY